MFVFGYDYNGQSGEYWNELYTYDKVWNDSSTSNTQKITGINTNNYWIQRYGVNFAPYRAMGWHDANWRRPNQRRSGGISVGDTGSSPMEYTNGSHPRYLYLGNRYVSVCGHCIFCNGCGCLKTGKAVFISATGATLEYDIENWSNNSTKQEYCGTIGSTLDDALYHADGTTGGVWTVQDREVLKDAKIFRLTTDPSDDGIPAIKKIIKGGVFDKLTGEPIPDADPIFNSSYFKELNIIRITGLGVIIPFYDTSIKYSHGVGMGGYLGGQGPTEIWSGDSGTMQLVMDPNTEEWVVTNSLGSYNLPDFTNTLRLWTGDTEYETLDPFTIPEDNYYRLENPYGLGTTGTTFTVESSMIDSNLTFGRGKSAAAFLRVESPINTETSLVEFETTLVNDFTSPFFDPSDQIINVQHGTNVPPAIPSDKIFYVPYESDGYTTERELQFVVNDGDPSQSPEASAYTWTSDPSIIFQTGTLSIQDPSTDEPIASVSKPISNVVTESLLDRIPNIIGGITGTDLLPFIGGTFDTVISVVDASGGDFLTEEITVVGMTGSTGPGLTYEKGLNQIRFDLTSGTQPELFPENRPNINYSATWDQEGGHVERDVNSTGFFNLPSIPERDGQTFNIEIRLRGAWDRNDGIMTIGQQSILGATYQARPD